MTDLKVRDLKATASARGKGLGGALIDHLMARGRSAQWDRLYWMTANDNAGARKLYDRYVQADQFVRYVVKLT